MDRLRNSLDCVFFRGRLRPRRGDQRSSPRPDRTAKPHFYSLAEKWLDWPYPTAHLLFELEAVFFGEGRWPRASLPAVPWYLLGFCSRDRRRSCIDAGFLLPSFVPR